MGIIVLHVAAVAVALMLKGPSADARQQTPPIEVMLLQQQSEPARPPEPRPQQPDIAPVQLVVPLLTIDVPAPPPITVAAVVTPAPPSPPAPVAVAVAEAPSESPAIASAADFLRLVTPVYPRAARDARVQGVVHVLALIDAAGHASKTAVHRSSGFAALDRAACESVQASLFKPYVYNGVPRSREIIVPITFELNIRGGGSPPRGRGRDDGPGPNGRDDHHAARGPVEEIGGLSAASLQRGE